MTESARDALERATARLSHEINNALAGIAGALRVLSDRIPPEIDVAMIMERIDGEVHRIEASVEELARFSKPREPVLVERNLHEVIEKALGRTRLETSTNVTRRFQEGLPPLRIDDAMIGQAIERLLINAQEAMPEGGTLTVSTAWDHHHVLVKIHDTGRGVPDDESEKIFEPFFTSKLRGLGLGLAITRTLVHAHGGDVSMASPGGTGTEFVITLPRTAEVSL